jgi:RNA polymerase-binding protein DksA
MPTPDTAAIRSRLEAQLAELAGALRDRHEELTQPLDADFAEQASQLEDQDTNQALESAHLSAIRQIRAALQRIEDGSYGTCMKCGGPIAPARLEALPTATLCIACAG